ncbi:MAG: cob(I)yrinic acid a,c-diamide adenosyltransferase [bacterium]|nr:cob(I)yrinic acid a,c-diamide adenosyltransferase [bacterium]
MTKKSTIYTKAGDKGQTSLLGGERVKKNHPRVRAYGSVDELSAALGLATSFAKNPEIAKILMKIQNELFNIGAELSSPKKMKNSASGGYFELKAEKLTELEVCIDSFDASLPPLHTFILPGGTPSASCLHLARTICRRAEREVSSLSESVSINPILVAYLNRLSDLLFVLARAENHGQDIAWKKK